MLAANVSEAERAAEAMDDFYDTPANVLDDRIVNWDVERLTVDGNGVIVDHIEPGTLR